MRFFPWSNFLTLHFLVNRKFIFRFYYSLILLSIPQRKIAKKNHFTKVCWLLFSIFWLCKQIYSEKEAYRLISSYPWLVIFYHIEKIFSGSLICVLKVVCWTTHEILFGIGGKRRASWCVCMCVSVNPPPKPFCGHKHTTNRPQVVATKQFRGGGNGVVPQAHSWKASWGHNTAFLFLGGRGGVAPCCDHKRFTPAPDRQTDSVWLPSERGLKGTFSRKMYFVAFIAPSFWTGKGQK